MRKIALLCSMPLFLYSYNLKELVELSHQNRLVESSKYNIQSQQKSYESTKDSYLPRVDLVASYLNATKESQTTAQNTLRGSASLKYTIYDGGKRGDLYSLKSLKVDSSKNSLEALKNDLSLQIARLYFEYESLKSDKDATGAQIKQLEAELERLKNFYEVGSATKDELDKIDSRVKNAILNLHEIELNILKIEHAFEYYVLKDSVSIDDGSTIKYVSDEHFEQRVDITSMEQDIESIKYDALSKKSLNYPTLFFDDTLAHNKYYFDDKTKESNFLIKTQNIASLNLSWNILDFGATTNDYEAKYAEYMSKKANLEHEKHKASVDYKLAKKSLDIAMQKIEASQATLEAAKETYELVKLKFENGVLDNVAYLESLSEVYDATKAYHRALNDAELKKVELIYFSGKNIKEYL